MCPFYAAVWWCIARFVLSNQCLDLHRSDGQIRKHNATEYDADMNRQMDTAKENDNVNHQTYDAKNCYKTEWNDFSVNQSTHRDSVTYNLSRYKIRQPRPE